MYPIRYTEEEKEAVLKHHDLTESEFEGILKHLNEWIQKTNLPFEDVTRNKLIAILLNSKMSAEKAKRCITDYYRLKNIYWDFFSNMFPNSESYNIASKLVKSVIMPQLTLDLCRISIIRIDDPQVEAKDILTYAFLPLMETEMRIHCGDYSVSNIIIIDFKNCCFKQLSLPLAAYQKLANMIVTINLRVKNIHYVNSPSYIDKVITIAKMFLPVKILNKICCHTDIETLYEYVPKKYLPSNYGGEQLALEKLHDQWCMFMQSKEAEYKKLLEVRYTCTEEEVYENEAFGVEGSFRKLTLD